MARPAIEEAIPGPWNSWLGIIALGVLASGGSGLWNAILTYLLKVKDIKKFEAKSMSQALETGEAQQE